MRVKLALFALFILAGLAFAIPSNCDETFDGNGGVSCSNAYGTVSANPAFSHGNFKETIFVNWTAVNANDYSLALGAEAFMHPQSFHYWGNVTVQEPTYGWVTHEEFLNDVTKWSNLSQTSEPCGVGEINERNRQKFNITYTPNASVSKVFCFRNILNQTPDYWVYWDRWEINGSHAVTREGWRELSVKNLSYGGKTWFYVQNVSFQPNEMKRSKVTVFFEPNTVGKFDALGWLSSKGIAQSVQDGTYLFNDPWWNASYPVRIPLIANNSVNMTKLYEFLGWNLTAVKGYCDANCTNVRVTMLNSLGVEIPWNLFNLTSNYSNGTNIASGHVAPSPAQAELWLYSTANTSADNQSQTVGYVYMNGTGVSSYAAQAQLFGSDLCDQSGWVMDKGGTWEAMSSKGCMNSITGNDWNLNRFWAGQEGGFLTFVGIGATGNDDTSIQPAIRVQDSSNYWGAYWTKAAAGGINKLLQLVGGAQTYLGSAVLPVRTQNDTFGISYYQSDALQLKGYYNNFNASEVQLTNRSEIANGTTIAGKYAGYGSWLATQPANISDLCYVYYPDDTHAYCRLYAYWGRSTTSLGSTTTLGVTVYHPLNASVTLPVNITFDADLNASTYPCNVTLDGVSIYNETHTEGVNTSFSWSTTAGFHTLNVTCTDGTAFSTARYFTGLAGLNVSIWAEPNASALIGNLSFYNGSTTAFSLSRMNYSITVSNLTAGAYTLTASSTGYQDRLFSVLMSNSSYAGLPILLLPASLSTFYSFHVQDSNGASQGASSYIITRTIAGTVYNVSSGTADSSGNFVQYLQAGVLYSISAQNSAGTCSATTAFTTGVSNPIIVVLSCGGGVTLWNSTTSSFEFVYNGSYLAAGNTTARTVTASPFFGSNVTVSAVSYTFIYLLNGTVVGTGSSASDRVTVNVLLATNATGRVQAWASATVNGTNYTEVRYFTISNTSSRGFLGQSQDALLSGNTDGSLKIALGFVFLVISIIVATWLGGATVFGTVLFILVFGMLNFVIPVVDWWWFAIMAITVFGWIYLRS